MPDVAFLTGILSQVMDQLAGVRQMLGLSDLSYFQYLSWQDIVNDAPLFNKVLFVACFFALVILFGMVRRHVFHLTMNGAIFGVVMGVLLVILAEVALVMGGKIVIQQAGGTGGSQQVVGGLNQVLGASGLGPVISVDEKGAGGDEVLQGFVKLSATDAAKVYEAICK